ncbi:hypothetical protein B0H10DRAFT_2231964 [Mycena sp. CBHHK59/15]|nr:hypothetical protein B0H10DRAFT_2231964 [Mycena sp. CBHHK59/15]
MHAKTTRVISSTPTDRAAPPPVCTFCLRTTSRSSFPPFPPRIGRPQINPTSPTQYWMPARLASTPILRVPPAILRVPSQSDRPRSRTPSAASRVVSLLTVAPASALLVSPSAPDYPER